MVSKKVTVVNESGFHLKPAETLCNIAIKFKSSVTFVTAKGTSSAKSILSVLAASVRCGDEIEVICQGEDEELALAEVCKGISNGLGDL